MKKEKRLRSRGGVPLRDAHLRLTELSKLFKKKRRKEKKVKKEESRLKRLRELKSAKFGTRPTNLRHRERMQYTHQKIQFRADGFGLVLPKPKQLRNIKRLSFQITNPNYKPKRGPGRPRKIKRIIRKPKPVDSPQIDQSPVREQIFERREIEETKNQEEEQSEDSGLQDMYENQYGQLREGLNTVSFYSRYAFDDRYSVLLGRKGQNGQVALQKMKIKNMYQNYPGTLLEYLRKVENSLLL